MAAQVLAETELYVSPAGTATNPGTKAAPLSLAAICARKDVPPGATIYLLGGAYKMTEKAEIRWKGRPDARIVMRSVPGEWAVLDGRIDLTGGARHLTFRDFEVTRTEDVNIHDPDWWNLPVRQRPSYTKRTDLEFKMGGQLIIALACEDIQFVNLYVHDNVSGGGFGLWNPAKNILVYGCLMIRNGWDDKIRGHGHGCYIQNGWPEQFADSVKRFRHNISAFNHSTGMKSYGSSPAIRHTHFEGNIYYCNGMTSWTNGSANYLAGSNKNEMDDIVLRGNHFYQPDACTGDVGGTVYLGWGSPKKKRCEFTDNYVFGGGSEAVRAQFWENLLFSGNTVYDDKRLFSVRDQDGRMKSWKWDRNTYYDNGVEKPIRSTKGAVSFAAWQRETGFDANSKWVPNKPKGLQVFLTPNEYDEDRAQLAVYNWDRLPKAKFDLSGFLKRGERFVVYDALEFRGRPVAHGRFDGGKVTVELRENPTGREFHALVVLRFPEASAAE